MHATPDSRCNVTRRARERQHHSCRAKGNTEIFQYKTWEFSAMSYRNDPKFLDRYAWTNSADPDQTAPGGADWSGSTLFASKQCRPRSLLLEEQSDQGLHCLPANSADPDHCSWSTLFASKQCRPKSLLLEEQSDQGLHCLPAYSADPDHCSWRSSLIRVYTVCLSLCIIWTHYSMVEPHSSNFRVITTFFFGVSEYLGNLGYSVNSQAIIPLCWIL